MKKFFYFFATLFLFQCQSDTNVREKARADVEAGRTTATAVANTESMEGFVESAQTPSTVNDALAMSLGSTTVAAGNIACLPVSIKGFSNLIGLQYTIRWNPDEVAYESIKNFNLKDLSNSNFGVDHTEKGVLAFSWIDMALNGVDQPDGTVIYDVCFSPKGESGAKYEIKFAPKPVTYEVVDAEENILKFVGKNGAITIQ